MRRTALFFFLLGTTLVAGSAIAGSDRVPALRGDPATVMQTYAALAQSDAVYAKAYYRQLSPAMRSDVWTVHVSRVLQQHPELMPEQRAVFFQALGLLTGGLIDGDASDAAAMRAQLAELKRLAAAELPHDIVARAFGTLTDEEFVIGNNALLPMEVIPEMGTPECSCSMTDDWCNGITNPDSVCKAARCTMVSGCGWFWLDYCTGICQAAP